MLNASDIKKELQTLSIPEKKRYFPKFFKTGKGEYGEGDKFIGVTMPSQRALVKKYKTIDYSQIELLLKDEFHECRMTGLLFLVNMYQKAKSEEQKKFIYEFYTSFLHSVNNWDLVDTSAPQIIGDYLLDKDRRILYDYAQSDNLWIQRIAILSTFAFIRNKQYDDTFAISRILLNHPHDLIHKGVGWMLREVGERDLNAELKFLNSLDNLSQKPVYMMMPRTMLRYAIEKFPEDMRQNYMKK